MEETMRIPFVVGPTAVALVAVEKPVSMAMLETVALDLPARLPMAQLTAATGYGSGGGGGGSGTSFGLGPCQPPC